MTAQIGSLRVALGLDTAEFQTGLKRVTDGLGGLGAAFAAIGGAAIFAGFTQQIGAAVGRIEETRRLTAQLDQAIANTGNTARTSGQEVADFADRLERSTGRAAEEILAVSSNLATFGFNREVFFEVIELADDMAAAWGGDLRQNIEGVSRALADPEKGLAMLTKRGITFTDEQKRLIASFQAANDEIGAQRVILDALNDQVQGVAAAGFTGLTAAQARATLATEDFFESIANGLGVSSGLEIALGAITFALDTVTANLGNIGRVATVVGAAVLTALGPTIWGIIAGASTAALTAILTGIRAIGAAIALNPIGFLVVALAAAVTAAFVFRDEIQQAIGVDVGEIVRTAANFVIQSFDLAFRNIVTIWNALPSALGDLVYQAAQSAINGVIYLVRNVQIALNGFFAQIDSGLQSIGASATGLNVGIADYVDLGNPFAGSGAGLAADLAQNLADTKGIDYVSALGSAFSRAGDQAVEATTKFAGFGDILDDETNGGGGGISRTTAAADGLSSSLSQTARIGEQVTSTLQSGFSDLFKGLIRGTTSAGEAIGNLLGRLGDLFIDQAFNILFNGTGGVGGIGAGIGSFFQNLFKFERGGTILPGGGGGIDSQLVAFRKSPNERVDITKPGQTLFNGNQQNNVHITTGVSVDRQGSISSYVESVVQNGIEVFNDALPVRVQQINADPRAR